jgi:glycosyltransferase involved in cell wall biosynthesis
MRAGHFIYHFNGMTAIERLLIRTGCNAASLVLCQSESLASQFRRIAPRSRIDFIYNMIDTEKFSNPALLAYEKNAVLFLGHLDHSKGYCDLIKALPRVVAAHPAAQFYFAGTKIKLKKRPHNVLHNQLTGARLDWVDPDQCFDDCVRGQYDRHYIYLGVLDEEKKIDWLRRCNMLVLPSYSEGFSMAVLEALAVGKPVVCTPVGALADVIQDGVHGLWVQPGDVEGLAKVIIAMLADGDTRDRMAATNYQYARSQFSKERIADQLIGRMQQVAGG